MTNEVLQIRPYRCPDCAAVNHLIRNIQLLEFGFTQDSFPQPELLEIRNYYVEAGGNFWVAFLDDNLVGTSALVNLGDGVGKLAKMFVDANYRGKPHQIAQRLLETTLQWASSQSFSLICLETTPEPCAAHAFYRRNGFLEVASSEFPDIYPLCSHCSKYFMIELGEGQSDEVV